MTNNWSFKESARFILGKYTLYFQTNGSAECDTPAWPCRKALFLTLYGAYILLPISHVSCHMHFDLQEEPKSSGANEGRGSVFLIAGNSPCPDSARPIRASFPESVVSLSGS